MKSDKSLIERKFSVGSVWITKEVVVFFAVVEELDGVCFGLVYPKLLFVVIGDVGDNIAI